MTITLMNNVVQTLGEAATAIRDDQLEEMESRAQPTPETPSDGFSMTPNAGATFLKSLWRNDDNDVSPTFSEFSSDLRAHSSDLSELASDLQKIGVGLIAMTVISAGLAVYALHKWFKRPMTAVAPAEGQETPKETPERLPREIEDKYAEVERFKKDRGDYSTDYRTRLGRAYSELGEMLYKAGYFYGSRSAYLNSALSFGYATYDLVEDADSGAFNGYFDLPIREARYRAHLASLEIVKRLGPAIDEYFEKKIGVADPEERKPMVEQTLDAIAWAFNNEKFEKHDLTNSPENVETLITDALATSQDLVDPAQAVKFAELDVKINSKTNDGRKSEMEALVRLADRHNKAGSNINVRATLQLALEIARANSDQAAVEKIITLDVGIFLQSANESIAAGDLKSANMAFVDAVRVAKASGNEALYSSFADTYISEAARLRSDSMAAGAVSLFNELGDEARTIQALTIHGEAKSFNTALELAATMQMDAERAGLLDWVIQARKKFENNILKIDDRLEFMRFEADLFAELGDHHRRGETLLRIGFVQKRYFVHERRMAFLTLEEVLKDAKARRDVELLDAAVRTFTSAGDKASIPEVEGPISKVEVAELLEKIGEYEGAVELLSRAGEEFQACGCHDYAKYSFLNAERLMKKPGVDKEKFAGLVIKAARARIESKNTSHRETGALGVIGRRTTRAIGVEGEGGLGAIGTERKGEEGKGHGKEERERKGIK